MAAYVFLNTFSKYCCISCISFEYVVSVFEDSVTLFDVCCLEVTANSPLIITTSMGKLAPAFIDVSMLNDMWFVDSLTIE